MTIYLIIVGIYLLSVTIAAPKFFEKAGQNQGLGYIPLINLFVWLKVIKRPLWWFILLIFPGVNFIMMIVMNVEMVKAFDLRERKEQWLAGALGFAYLPYLAFKQKLNYVGPEDWSNRKKSAAREWGEAIVFAVVAASIIRSYFLEAFTIPTSSMEKSMLIGDYLFVSKLSYGPKIPQTPLAIPFVHHTIPVFNSKSYTEFIKLPHFRLPGFGDVERNDVVVFNYPDGDTVVVAQQNRGYQQILRDEAFFRYKLADMQSGRPLKSDSQYLAIARAGITMNNDITVRPVDKRENYIKRCVGVPGDKLEVVDGQLRINDEDAFMPEDMQYNYNISSKVGLNKRAMKDNYDVNGEDFDNGSIGYNNYNLPLTKSSYEALKMQVSGIDNIVPDFTAKGEFKPMIRNILLQYNGPELGTKILGDMANAGNYNPQLSIFPNHPKYNWTEDNFGPIVIPKKGVTIDLNLDNLPLYERVIKLYEGNSLRISDNKIFINDVETSSYTFNMDYYFMMGDNRHNSADSRFWGFVPEDHIVGKAVFIWLSLDKEKGWFDGKIRWDRVFSFVK